MSINQGEWRRSADSARKLPKSVGIRDAVRLRALLFEAGLGRLWGCEPADADLVLFAKVHYRIEQDVRGLADPVLREFARVAYNLDPDPELCHLPLWERCRRFRQRHPGVPGYADRSISRRLKEIGDRVERSLLASPPPFPEEELLAVARREARFSDRPRDRVDPTEFGRAVGRCYSSSVEDAIAAFLRLVVVVPSSHTNEMIICRTAGQGDWLCVFSTDATFREHRKAAPEQPGDGSFTTVLGAQLVRALVSRWNHVGIVVDPLATRSAEAARETVRTLRIPPRELARLAEAG